MIPKSRLSKIKNFYDIFFDNIIFCQKIPIVYKLNLHLNLLNLHPGKSNEICADSESGPLTGRDADRRREDVKNREDGGRGDRDRQDLIHRERLARDKNQRKRNSDALNQVLDDARQKIVDVHFYILTSDFFDSLRSTTPG